MSEKEPCPAARGCGCMTFPACGREGGPDAFPCVLADSCEGAPFGVDEVGAADEGRDQPGPVVVEGWEVAVNFAVTRREEWADGARASRTGSNILQSQNCGESLCAATHQKGPRV